MRVGALALGAVGATDGLIEVVVKFVIRKES
jgi:hypothetical protein